MADIRDLRRRIKGVQNTQKITKGMKTMSAIRLQRAQARSLAAKPYTGAVQDMVSYLTEDNAYFAQNKSKATLYVVFTSDRGLCGAFNDNLLRKVESELTDDDLLLLIGTKAVAYFNRRGREIYAKYAQLPVDPTISLSNLVMNDCRKLFLEGKVGSIVLAYNHFISKMNYGIQFHKLLPIQRKTRHKEKGMKLLFLYEPEQAAVMNAVIDIYLESTVFQCFLDSYASEYAARLIAMSKATDNAEEMVRTLTLEMNKTRQANITSEILEVVSGAEALRI